MTSQTHAGSESETAPATESSLPPPADTPESPPSAEDFWGERAASIHDALQAPTDEWPPSGAGLTARVNSPRVPAGRLRRDRVLLAAACLALVSAIGLAVALNPLTAATARRGRDVGSKIPLASVLSNGVSRALTLDLSRIGPTSAKSRRGSTRIRRRASHTRLISEPVRDTTPARTTVAVSAHAATSTYTERVAPPAPVPVETSNHPAASTGSPGTRPTSSSAPLSATGASGALGPIQSPNG